MRWLDTNIFVRYLTNDDPIKAQACFALFDRLDRGAEEVRTSEAVVCEVVYVLSARGHYGLARADIRSLLSPVLALRGLRLPQKALYVRALELYAQIPRLDFEDALSIAHMEDEGVTELYSYDTDFDRVGGITRVEPL